MANLPAESPVVQKPQGVRRLIKQKGRKLNEKVTQIADQMPVPTGA